MAAHVEPATLLAQLREDLGLRRIQQGFQRLERIKPMFEDLEPSRDFGILVGLIAQWVDAGYEDESLVSRLLDRFPKNSRPALPLLDYLHLRMAEGVVAMAQENLDQAVAHFRIVQSFEDEVQDPELFAIANFWMGRCYRRMGHYDEALQYTQRGEEQALSCGYLQMAAIMQTTKSWLAFQKGRLREANTLLHRAEDALNGTDDYLSRGNIQSAYGRIARRQGKYDRAVECFDIANAEYRRCGGENLQLARTLLNLAFVKRLLALHAQKELDQVAATRRTETRPAGDTAKTARDTQRLRIEGTRAQAWAHLEEAAAIYSRHQNQRGIAGVHLNRGFLYLDSGDLECAAAEAAEAFTHGAQKSDHIIMARARTLECIVEHTAIEEQVGDPPQHRDAAATFAADALKFAGHTENRRLLARAYVWQGLTFAIEPADLEAARVCAEKAVALLEPDASERQYIWDDLEMLKRRIARAMPVDAVLRAWCNGIVENQSFQQMSEEFARIVIPRVWEREDRKVSRVAEKLSISPKKVRRILHSAGVREPGNERRES
jgi:tetratricopeptide (TPR) repeat protein